MNKKSIAVVGIVEGLTSEQAYQCFLIACRFFFNDYLPKSQGRVFWDELFEATGGSPTLCYKAAMVCLRNAYRLHQLGSPLKPITLLVDAVPRHVVNASKATGLG